MHISSWSSDVCSSDLERARRSLRPDQIAAIEESCEIVAVNIPTIELAGGSVRCMIAGVHLDRRPVDGPRELSDAVEAINEDHPVTPEIGKAAGRERVCQYG